MARKFSDIFQLNQDLDSSMDENLVESFDYEANVTDTSADADDTEMEYTNIDTKENILDTDIGYTLKSGDTNINVLDTEVGDTEMSYSNKCEDSDNRKEKSCTPSLPDASNLSLDLGFTIPKYAGTTPDKLMPTDSKVVSDDDLQDGKEVEEEACEMTFFEQVYAELLKTPEEENKPFMLPTIIEEEEPESSEEEQWVETHDKWEEPEDKWEEPKDNWEEPEDKGEEPDDKWAGPNDKWEGPKDKWGEPEDKGEEHKDEWKEPEGKGVKLRDGCEEHGNDCKEGMNDKDDIESRILLPQDGSDIINTETGSEEVTRDETNVELLETTKDTVSGTCDGDHDVKPASSADSCIDGVHCDQLTQNKGCIMSCDSSSDASDSVHCMPLISENNDRKTESAETEEDITFESSPLECSLLFRYDQNIMDVCNRNSSRQTKSIETKDNIVCKISSEESKNE